MRQLCATAFVMATVPVLAAQQFMPTAPTTAVDPATRFEAWLA